MSVHEERTQRELIPFDNIHEVIGWHRCANLACRRQLGLDPVTLITSTRVRRFCTVE